MLDLNSTTYGLLSGMPWFFTELPVLGKCSACIDFLIYMRFSEWCLVVLETLAWKLIPIVLCIRGLRKVLPRDPRHRWGCTRSPTRSTASVGFAQGPPCDPLHRWGGIRSTCVLPHRSCARSPMRSNVSVGLHKVSHAIHCIGGVALGLPCDPLHRWEYTMSDIPQFHEMHKVSHAIQCIGGVAQGLPSDPKQKMTSMVIRCGVVS